MAGNGGYRDVMEVAWVGHGGHQSQGGAWGQAEGRRVERGAPKGGLWAADPARVEADVQALYKAGEGRMGTDKITM